MTIAEPRRQAVFLMGPTAAGKTDLAVALAQRFPFEIISVDSALVYRGMDIGTAKPDAATLRAAPHRLIDILDPAEAYSAARFCEDARREMAEVWCRGRIPLLTGGTMLYFRALQQGLSELPASDPLLRTRLQAELAGQGLAALHARLAEVDPVAAARIHPHDSQRILRALEVHELTSRPITELYSGKRDELFSSGVLKLIVAPPAREILHERIEQRFHRMLACGFIAEVERLRARGDLNLEKPAMRAVGYRQVWHYLEGLTDYCGMVSRSIIATRQFAKRQLTWLRAEPEAVWLDPTTRQFLDQAISHIRQGGLLSP